MFMYPHLFAFNAHEGKCQVLSLLDIHFLPTTHQLMLLGRLSDAWVLSKKCHSRYESELSKSKNWASLRNT